MSVTKIAKAAIKIPMRIERGPTDILRALASTVNHLPKEPSVILADDMFLIPRRPLDTSNYILSKLSGKRAARFIFNKNPELFFRDQAEPKIEAFATPEKFSPEMEFTEEDIKWCVENMDIENALVAYESMNEKGNKISNKTLLDLFEMICYTNEQKLMDDLDVGISGHVVEHQNQLVNYTWVPAGTAHKIFNKIKDESDPSRIYSSMIAGLSKFNEHATAKQIFDEFKTNHPDKALYLPAYEGLLASVPRLYSSIETVHEAIHEIVQHMEANLVKPNLIIFNTLLKCYRTFRCDETTCHNAFKLLNDMKALNIAPSLATYSELVSIICRANNARSYRSMVPEILEIIVSSDSIVKVRDEADLEFLPNVMGVVANILNNLRLAKKLLRISLKNPHLFKNKLRQGHFLNSYFRLLITTSSLDDAISFYGTYVPMVFRPQPDTYDALAEALDLFGADDELIKSIGSDIVEFGLEEKVQNDKIFRRYPIYEQMITEKAERMSKRP